MNGPEKSSIGNHIYLIGKIKEHFCKFLVLTEFWKLFFEKEE